MVKEKLKNNLVLVSSLSKFIYILNKLSFYLIERLRFYKKLKYKLNLKNPKSFNEKIVWRKIYDRNNLLPITADKYKVRQYIKDVLGEEQAEEILIPLVYVTNKPETIPFDDLPNEYIIKANHASGWNIIVRKGDGVNKEGIIRQSSQWLEASYGLHKLEWAYQPIERKIIIETLLRDESGNIPKDYKFHIFNGKCELIHVDIDRFDDHKRSLFTPDWKHLNVGLKYKKGPKIKQPKNLNEMLGLAEKLASQFDYMRVDLYSIGEKIYFGELTPYHGSGMERFNPQKFDFGLGYKWQIKK